MSHQPSSIECRCVGSTGGLFRTPIKKIGQDAAEHNFFRHALFSGDGTSIITHNEDHQLRTFVLPTNLLEDGGHPKSLEVYSSHPSPTPIQNYALYPGFALQDPSTTLVLSASSEQPLTVRNALDYRTVHAQYSWISPTTEAYYLISSLTFTQNGSHFVAGGKNQIAVFDCEHAHEGPEATFKTGRSRKARKLYGQLSMTCQGIVSAMAIRADDGVLAAGTTEREVGLYEAEGSGDCITAFSVGDEQGTGEKPKGTGVTGLRWSPCSHYLIIAERQTDILQVYDIRNTLRRVSVLTGRQAETTQKLGFDLVPTAEGYEVWAGGTDGVVRMWKDPGTKGGEVGPSIETKMHTDTVGSVAWHHSAVVLATCSGSRRHREGDQDDNFDDEYQGHTSSSQASAIDSTLRVWTM